MNSFCLDCNRIHAEIDEHVECLKKRHRISLEIPANTGKRRKAAAARRKTATARNLPGAPRRPPGITWRSLWRRKATPAGDQDVREK